MMNPFCLKVNISNKKTSTQTRVTLFGWRKNLYQILAHSNGVYQVGCTSRHFVCIFFPTSKNSWNSSTWFIWYCSNRGWASEKSPLIRWRILWKPTWWRLDRCWFHDDSISPWKAWTFQCFFFGKFSLSIGWELWNLNQWKLIVLSYILNFDLHVFFLWTKPTNPAFSTASNACIGGFSLVVACWSDAEWWATKNPQDIAVRLSEIRMASTCEDANLKGKSASFQFAGVVS